MEIPEEAEVRPHEFPVEYQVTLLIKKAEDGKVYAEVWGTRTAGNLSRWTTDVLDIKVKYGTLKIPEESFDCLVHHLCFDEVEISSMGNASADLATIFRAIRRRFSRKK